LLGGIARAVSRRTTISFYSPTVVWVFLLLVLVIQFGGWIFRSAKMPTGSGDMREKYFESRFWSARPSTARPSTRSGRSAQDDTVAALRETMTRF
jgi:hypothetical protein